MALASGLALLGGCAKPRSEAVFVELPTPEAVDAGRFSVPATEFSLPAETVQLPALPENGGPSEGKTAEHLKALMQTNRERTYRQLLGRLQAAYRRRAALLRSELQAEFPSIRGDAMDKATAKISEKYQAYADVKGPLVVRVAILSGFPDPDPGSSRAPLPSDPTATRRFNEARQVRDKIGLLEKDFHAFSVGALAEATKEADAEIASRLAELERQLAQIEEETRRQAARELRRTQRELRPLLADSPPLKLPAVPAQEVAIPAVHITIPAIQSAIAPPEILAEPATKLKTELQIWLRVNRYVLAERGKARDATADFLAWRQQFQTHPNPIPTPAQKPGPP